MDLLLTAFMWGAISAVSLPIGSVIGLVTKPNQKVTAALMAFGAGALLFALTIELFSEILHYSREHDIKIVIIMIIAAIFGGILFQILNYLLNRKGGFLKSKAETIKYIRKLKIKKAGRMLSQLSSIHLIKSLPPYEIVQLISHLKSVHIKPGQIIFNEGDTDKALYFIHKGEVELLKKDLNKKEKQISVLNTNDTFGEIAFLGHRKREFTARTLIETELLIVEHVDFITLLSHSKELKKRMEQLLNQDIEKLTKRSHDPKAKKWKVECLKYLRHIPFHPTENELNHHTSSVSKKGGASLAIWLGILLDGIPESMIIGILSKSITGVSMAFIVSVFLANLPEALSSSVGMISSGMGLLKILIMWGSLCLFTGLGALVGALIFPANIEGSTYYYVSAIEGLAAGAMLTMIAETMLPEAYEQGGAIVGLATLLGFLAALLVKIL